MFCDCSVPDNLNLWLKLVCNFEEIKLQSYKENLFILYSLWARFFLLIEHIDQGMTHLRRLCVIVGAASQISYSLTKVICFYNTKYYLDYCRIILSKNLMESDKCALIPSVRESVTAENNSKGNTDVLQ